MVRCRKCGWEYGDWQGQCPQCGTPLSKRQKPLTRFLAVAGILVIVIVGYLLFGGGFPGGGWTSPTSPTFTAAPTTPTVTPTPTGPPCTVNALPIVAIQRPGGNVELSVQGGGDLSITKSLDVRLNGVSVGSLQPNVGAMTTVKGVKGGDVVVVVANSTCGKESVVLQKNL
jgi:hypothetical protein